MSDSTQYNPTGAKSNEDRLQEAGLLKSRDSLSPEQKEALESLTPTEIESLISAREKLRNAFPVGSHAARDTHFAPDSVDTHFSSEHVDTHFRKES